MASEGNPYAAPGDDFRAVGVNSGRREDLKNVAVYQKGILICILIEILAAVTLFVAPSAAIIVQVVYLVAHLASIAFVFLLAMKLYQTAPGILIGILSVVPCLGLLILLMINGKATTILRANGLKVGLLGVNLSEV